MKVYGGYLKVYEGFWKYMEVYKVYPEKLKNLLFPPVSPTLFDLIRPYSNTLCFILAYFGLICFILFDFALS